MLDIILLTHNHLENTKRCLEALYENTGVPFLLWVIDDSTDSTSTYFRQLNEEKHNICFYHPVVPITSANMVINMGKKLTLSDPFVFLTNSTFVTKGWLDKALPLMDNPKVGIVGFKLVDPETHRIVDAAGEGIGWLEDSLTFASEVIRVAWAAVLIRRAALHELDENYYIGFRGVDDTDNCFEIRNRGWKIIYNGYGIIYHKPCSSNGKEMGENCKRFLEKWKDDPLVNKSGITVGGR